MHHRLRRRSVRGFTLVELMAVITIVAVMAALAMATMSRSGGAQDSAALARSLQFAIQSARSATLSDNFMRRLSCTLQTTDSYCYVERADKAGMSPTAWPPATGTIQEARIDAGSHATIWNVVSSTDATASNNGTTQVSGAKYLYLRPDGTVGDSQTNISGVTFYVGDTLGTTHTSNQYKVYVYAITGMPRMVNQW